MKAAPSTRPGVRPDEAADRDEAVEHFTRACHERGLPVTHQRLAVYRTLLESHEHPDAEGIHRTLHGAYPSLSLGTVYKTLELLEGLGLVREVGAPGARRRFDANHHRHHHLWCVRCHRLDDVEHAALDTLSLPPSVGFEVTDYTIQFNGVCASCRAREAQSKS
ncbi:MAG: Fur family transcriptional regulator [Candidatus Eiseniibacteriota bacterium]